MAAMTEERMDELAAEAQRRFPFPDDALWIAKVTGNREHLNPITRARVFWMLSEAERCAKS